MKRHLIPIILVFLLINILSSCSKKPPMSLSDIFECHEAMKWDSTSISKKLIGEWEWEFVTNINSSRGNTSEYKGRSIVFQPDHTLLIKIDGEVTQTTNWSIYRDYYLKSSPFVIGGSVHLCDDLVGFIQSYEDGVNHYYRKSE